MHAFNTTWVNSPAWCTIKIELYLQQLLTSLSFQELFISLKYYRRSKLPSQALTEWIIFDLIL